MLFPSYPPYFPHRVAVPFMAVMVAADQAVKVWVRTNLPLHRSSPLVPNFLELTHVENKGVSFSMFGGLGSPLRVPLLVTISVLAVAVLTYFWIRHRGNFNRFSEAAFLLILPGAVGNLIDRAIYGTVTDYLHFRYYGTSFFVNNLADILISAGVIAYLIGVLRRRPSPYL